MPAETNPAEFYLDLINTDLSREGSDIFARVEQITKSWAKSTLASYLDESIEKNMATGKNAQGASDFPKMKVETPSHSAVLLVLLHRSWIKAYRDIVAYGIRIIMYLGLAILMGTVFLRLKNGQEYIQPFINAIFFGSAFMSFMAVAYVPAFLEDLHTFSKERANGLVGPLAFSIANFLIGLPFLFGIALLFSIVEYFLTDFRQSASAFFIFTMWLFLDLVAAEALVVMISAIFPVFVVALAVTAFVNGLWMCVDGFLVPMNILNPFWKYVFHYIDYQAYVFQGMMVNEFKDRIYSCDETGPGSYHCMYASDLNTVGEIRGSAVLQTFRIGLTHQNEWIGLTIAIIAGYRILAYLVLHFRKH
jgi:ABC-type multidrug transport system permease subunit